MKNYKALLKPITTFIFDYDGVLTDGTVVLMAEGEPLRTANVKDGYALQLAVKKGYNVAVISGGRSKTIHHRLQMLNVHDVFIGVESKYEVLMKYMEEKGLSKEQIIYMGDDIPDYHVMHEAGIAACPADAADEIKSISDYISPLAGGQGCARDIIEQVMKVQGNWMNNDAFKW
jgi:3-deoxy-D-manno-octulosonate 8-phosphate phosphatase (KDO 8-P phosphatase)